MCLTKKLKQRELHLKESVVACRYDDSNLIGVWKFSAYSPIQICTYQIYGTLR